MRDPLIVHGVGALATGSAFASLLGYAPPIAAVMAILFYVVEFATMGVRLFNRRKTNADKGGPAASD